MTLTWCVSGELSRGQKRRLLKGNKKQMDNVAGSGASASGSEEEDPPEKKAAPSPVEIGRDGARLVCRHDAAGKHRSSDAKNTHITVGRVTVKVSALEAVYGRRLCHGALCSFRKGDQRLMLCDQPKDARHLKAGSGAHKLPARSGPGDYAKWKRVMKLSKAE